MASENYGEFGGTVIRSFKGDGKSFIAGATLSPEEVMTWPIGNRMALHMDGKVDWYGPPSPAEETVRQAGANTPSKAPAAPRVPKAPAKAAAPAPAAGRRQRGK